MPPDKPPHATRRRSLLNGIIGVAIGIIAGGQFLAVDVPVYFTMAASAMALVGFATLPRMKSFDLARALALTALCVAPLFVSITLNGGGFDQAASPLALTAFALSAYALGRGADEMDWRQILTVAGLAGLVCFSVAAALYGWDVLGTLRTGRRLETGMHPNLVGLTALTVFLVAAPAPSRILWMSCFVVAVVACLAASSRASLLTVMIVFAAARLMAWRRQPAVLTGALVVGLLGLTASLLFAGPWLTWLADTVFHVNDNHRGIASGGSGRLRLWAYFVEVWLREPLFGPGPGTALEMNGRAIYSHNLVLQILCDSGVVGLLSFTVFIAAVVFASSRKTTPPHLRTGATLALMTYFIYGLFEGRAINVGNPLSATFFFLTFAALGASDPFRVRLAGTASGPKRLPPGLCSAPVFPDSAQHRGPIA